MTNTKQLRDLTDAEYMALADFRYEIRKYLRYMEAKVRSIGHNPQQCQLLLAIKGLPKGKMPTITTLSERMQVNHNTMVELVDRCEKRGFIHRTRSAVDRRKVALVLTPEGQLVMQQQANASREELRAVGPLLCASLQQLMHRNQPKTRRAN